MSYQLHQKTPVLTSMDGRGAMLRTVAYHRVAADGPTSTRATLQRYDARGHRVEQWDPRLSALAETDTQVMANQKTCFSLSGQALRNESVDAGWRLTLYNAAKQTAFRWDGRGTSSRCDFDEQLRPVALFEIAKGQTDERCDEHFVYAATGPEDARRNRCGRVLRHDDPAGSLWHESFAVSGQPLIETRRFCTALTAPDWPDAPLQTERYTTRWRYNALGVVIGQTDAAGHVRTFDVDIAGRCSASQLDGVAVLKSCEYNAFDQVYREQAGNNVLTIARYSPVNGQLLSLKATTGTGHLLQDLHYQYDPVGNIERIQDQAQPVQWFAQQRIEAVNTYRYDTLYQLIEATGRENASQRIGPGLPGLELFASRDDSRWRNYSQTYSYDSGNNLTTLKHDAGTGNTVLRHMAVAHYSNRSLLMGDGAVDFAGGFDANGNQQQLAPGQWMLWDTRNQLHQVTQVVREAPDGQDDDVETYIYDSEGQRVRKVRRAKTGGGEQISQVLYLPGLEIRTQYSDEELHVVTTQAGRSPVRVLHWAGIHQDQWRYSLNDHLGSSTLELNETGELISQESFYPFGGTSWWAARSMVHAQYKTARYSGKERDATGLYYYGMRYYAPWLQRWISTDPAGEIDGLNIYAMLNNNPITYRDLKGLVKDKAVPNVIHHFWQGDLKNLEQHHSNLRKISQTNSTYKVELHVLPNPDQEAHLAALQSSLGSGVKVSNIKDEKWFKQFQKKERYQQFEASRNGERSHLASGSDIIKTELTYKLGGVFNDVDNVPIAPLPSTLQHKENTLMTAGPTQFNRWGGEKGIHSSTFATYKKNPILKEMNKESFKKFKAMQHIIYRRNEQTANPDDHFKMISETAGSLHFSRELKRLDTGFNTALEKLMLTSNKYDEGNIIFDKYFKPTTTTGAGAFDEDQMIALLNAMSAPGHVMI